MASDRAGTWEVAPLRIGPIALLGAWLTLALSVLVAAWIAPGVELGTPRYALAVAAALGLLNALIPPLIAALPLPYMLALGFVAVLLLDAALLLLAAELLGDRIEVASFGNALLAALLIAAVGAVLDAIRGAEDDGRYTLHVVRRVARRLGATERTDVPGILFLEIDGLAQPVLRDAMRDGSAPTMARWCSEEGYVVTEWETDLSSQTGASQAGILLGSNDGIPAFRWLEKESGRLMTCSSSGDCAELERRLSTGHGLLRDGGASRGNLLSGDAAETILTVSRLDAERRANPGYRAFLANGFNVTRLLVGLTWEVVLELSAAIRQRRRDVRPRGKRGGVYPLVRAAMCVGIRDLVIFGVLTDMMRGCPAVYATFASYDEVAHHSGLQRPDTMEALRKLDRQFARLAAARRYAPRPYEIVVLSDHGQTQGATFKQRNGYGLDDLVARSLGSRRVDAPDVGDEHAVVGQLAAEATGRHPPTGEREAARGQEAIVLASGNLGLIYLMAERRRMSLEEIDRHYPDLIPALLAHRHVGWLLVRSRADGALAIGRDGIRMLESDRLIGGDPLAAFSAHAGRHLRRADGFAHVADIVLGSFYDPQLDEGCAFEELISFHGGLGGPQTRPFLLHPARLAAPDGELVGAEAVHRVLARWRSELAAGRGGPGRDRGGGRAVSDAA